MLEDIKNVYDKVKLILEKYPPSRDDDTLLYLAFLNANYAFKDRVNSATEPYEIIKHIMLKAPKFESVRRCRQKIQEEGLFIGTNRKHRKQEEEKIREFYREEKIPFPNDN